MINDKCFLAGRQMREQKMSQANYSSAEWLQVMQKEEEECVWEHHLCCACSDTAWEQDNFPTLLYRDHDSVH